MRDPYTVLGVARGASDAEIKKAYRKIAKDNHPDRNQDNPAKLEKFKEASAANALLSDTEQRGRFDRGEIDAEGNPKAPAGFGGGSGHPGGGFAGGGFDEELRRRMAPKGADLAYRLSVPFEDAATLKPQRVSLKNGKTLDLKLPPGFSADKPLRMAGQGEAGAGGAGDALITLDIAAHRFFKRDGDDVRLDLPVTLGEAVDGAKVRVPTPDGPVTLTVAPGSSSGRVLRLRGRGFTRTDGTRGDLLVTIEVDLPHDDAELRAFTARWRDGRSVRAALGVD